MPLPSDKRKDARFCSAKCRAGSSHAAHRETRLEAMKEYREMHPETFVTASRKYKLSDVRRQMLQSAKYRAKKAGLPFNLTLEDIGPLPEYCPVLGIPLEVGHGAYAAGSPSLDKIIPSMGYVRGNVLVVSMRANILKRDATVPELRALADFYERYIRTNWMIYPKETPT